MYITAAIIVLERSRYDIFIIALYILYNNTHYSLVLITVFINCTIMVFFFGVKTSWWKFDGEMFVENVTCYQINY